MFNHFRKVNEFTRANSSHDRLWRFYGDRKIVALNTQSVYSFSRPNETRHGGAPNERGSTMTTTTTMPIRVYAIQFTEGNVYSTYEYLHRRGDFYPLVRDVDPEGNVSVVPEHFDTWTEGEPLTFDETCIQYASDLMWEVAINAQELFEDSIDDGDDSRSLFIKAERSMEVTFERMGWSVDMVSFIPGEPIACDGQTVAIATPNGVSFLF